MIKLVDIDALQKASEKSKEYIDTIINNENISSETFDLLKEQIDIIAEAVMLGVAKLEHEDTIVHNLKRIINSQEDSIANLQDTIADYKKTTGDSVFADLDLPRMFDILKGQLDTISDALIYSTVNYQGLSGKVDLLKRYINDLPNIKNNDNMVGYPENYFNNVVTRILDDINTLSDAIIRSSSSVVINAENITEIKKTLHDQAEIIDYLSNEKTNYPEFSTMSNTLFISLKEQISVLSDAVLDAAGVLVRHDDIISTLKKDLSQRITNIVEKEESDTHALLDMMDKLADTSILHSINTDNKASASEVKSIKKTISDLRDKVQDLVEALDSVKERLGALES